MSQQTAPSPNTGISNLATKGSRRAILAAVGLALVFLFLGYLGYRWMQSSALAHLTQIAGGAERDTQAHVEQWQSAAVGDGFEDGDGARTPANAEALFRLLNGARLKLKASSQVRFSRRGPKGALGVQVEMGEAEVQTDAGQVTLASEFGDLVLDAGSSIIMRRDGAQLNVEVELGRLQLGDRGARAGERMTLMLGGIVVDVPLPETAAPVPPPAPSATEAPAPAASALQVGAGVARADLVAKAGDSFVVHDPSPPTAIGFDVSLVCNGPGRLSAGSQATESGGQANLRFPRGATQYEVRCLANPNEVVAKGNVRVLQDAGTQQLPTFAPTANVVTDGRRYSVMYQHRLPNITVSWPTAPQAAQYTLTIDGKKISTSSASHTFKSLSRGTHSVTFSAATSPVRQSRTTTIEVLYDTQAPAARVSDPPIGFEPGENVALSGQALPGWSVSVQGKAVEVDPEYKFSTTVTGGDAIPIAFSHPTYGQHYYIRRPRAAP